MSLKTQIVEFGASSLTDQELVAAIVSARLENPANQLMVIRLLNALTDWRQPPGKLAAKLKAVPGMGAARVSSLIAAVELGQRLAQRPALRFGQFYTKEAVIDHLQQAMNHLSQELLYVVYLDVHNAVIKETVVAKGGLDLAVSDPRVIFQQALLLGASRLIVAHNHPSGDVQPSEADRSLTKRLMAGGQLLSIVVLDHLIFGNGRYYSFADAVDSPDH